MLLRTQILHPELSYTIKDENFVSIEIKALQQKNIENKGLFRKILKLAAVLFVRLSL
jgi:hypothetical protein